MLAAIKATFALLASFALLSCSSVEFEQTTERGSLMEYEEARIPESYRGLWASPKDACFVTRDYGMQMEIGERSFGDVAVRRIWFYSDYPDIVVELDTPEGEADPPVTMFLQLSFDEQKIRVRQSGDRQERIFHRCKVT
jgi:hypothetical protein